MFKAEVFFGGSHFLSLYLTKSCWAGVAGKTNAPPGGPSSFPGAARWFQVPCLGTSPTSACSEPRSCHILTTFGMWLHFRPLGTGPG